MINLKIKLALLAALTVATATKAAELPAPKTNNVMALNFTLTAWPSVTAIQPDEALDLPLASLQTANQISNAPFRIMSRDIIASLNGVTNNDVAMHFGSGAQLLLKQIISLRTVVTNGLGTNNQIIVRQQVSGKNQDTDVSDFFYNSISGVSTNSTNRGENQEILSTFAMVSPGSLNFQLSTLTAQTASSKESNGVPVIQSLSVSVQGSGSESSHTNNFILGGSISTGMPQLE
jgi:hypothetical protein